MTAVSTGGTTDGGGGVGEGVGLAAELLLLAAGSATAGLVVVAAVRLYTYLVYQTGRRGLLTEGVVSASLAALRRLNKLITI